MSGSVRTRAIRAWTLASRLMARMGQHHAMVFARAIALSMLLSLAPLLVLAVWLFGVLDATALVERGIAQLDGFLPPDALEVIEADLLGAAEARAATTGVVPLLVALGLSLWGASGVASTLVEAVDATVGDRPERGALGRYLLRLGVAAGLVLVVAAAVAVLAGALGGLARLLGASEAVVGQLAMARFPLGLLLLGAGTWLLLYVAAGTRLPARAITLGALVVTVGWAVLAAALGHAVGLVAGVAGAWGAAAGPVVLIVVLYWMALVLMVGTHVAAARR